MSDTSGSDGGTFLDKKAGPFKGQTWVILIGGALIVVFLVYRKMTTGSSGASTLTTDSLSSPDAVSSQAGGSSSGTVNTANGNPQTFSNASWASTAANQLIAQGDDPASVSNALAKYLDGGQLDATESAIVARAITIFGEPPQGVLPVSTSAPTPTASSNPNHYAQYTLLSGDTWLTLAQRFLGTSNVSALQSANPGVTSLAPGQVINIPNENVPQYALPNGANSTLVWILGQKGVRRGGVYYVTGNKATFTGLSTQPAGVPVVTDASQIAALQKKVSGLR